MKIVIKWLLIKHVGYERWPVTEKWFVLLQRTIERPYLKWKYSSSWYVILGDSHMISLITAITISCSVNLLLRGKCYIIIEQIANLGEAKLPSYYGLSFCYSLLSADFF